jgi:hypothetical protein
MKAWALIGMVAPTVGAALLACAAVTPAEASPIYNGGPVISGTPDVYFIWYGGWGSNTAQTILPTFVSGLTGTPYLATETSMSGDGLVSFGGSTHISSTTNSSLYLGGLKNPSSQIASIVEGALSLNLLPTDPNGIYDVLTAPGLFVKGFNTSFCGYHDSTNWGGSSLGVQFGFIGDPTSTQRGCYVQKTSPNGNFGADAMASVIAHELIETVTDPTGTAWWDSQSASSTYGYEDADMCAWNFGSVYKTANGSSANYSSGGKNYLLQQEWVNTGGGLGTTGGMCAMSYTGTASASLVSGGGGFNIARAVPEPNTLSLFSTILAGVAVARRRKAKAA